MPRDGAGNLSMFQAVIRNLRKVLFPIGQPFLFVPLFQIRFGQKQIGFAIGVQIDFMTPDLHCFFDLAAVAVVAAQSQQNVGLIGVLYLPLGHLRFGHVVLTCASMPPTVTGIFLAMRFKQIERKISCAFSGAVVHNHLIAKGIVFARERLLGPFEIKIRILPVECFEKRTCAGGEAAGIELPGEFEGFTLHLPIAGVQTQ